MLPNSAKIRSDGFKFLPVNSLELEGFLGAV